MSAAKEVKEIIKKGNTRQINGAQIEKFIKASEKFDDLVRRGLIKRRGYQLMGVDNAHNARTLINTRQ